MIVTTFTDLPPKLTSSTVATTTLPVWDNSTVYTVGTEVVYEDKIWKSASDDNSDNTPDSDSLVWVYDRLPNNLQMFDPYPITQTVDTSDIVLEFDHIKKYSSIVFGNMHCGDIHIELMRQDGVLFFDKTIEMVEVEDSTNWFRFFTDYGELYQKYEHIETITQTELDIKARITITTYLGEVKIGLIGFGSDEVVGCTLNNESYTDNPDLTLEKINGTLKPIGGDNAWGEMSYSVYAKDRYFLKQKLKRLNGKSVLFKGDDDGTDLIHSVLGFFTGFEMDIPNYTATFKVYTVDGT